MASFGGSVAVSMVIVMHRYPMQNHVEIKVDVSTGVSVHHVVLLGWNGMGGLDFFPPKKSGDKRAMGRSENPPPPIQ